MDNLTRKSETAAPEPTAPDYTQRVTFTFMVGVYLAINAVRDLYLLVEGPDCAYMKTQYVQGNHDWLSTLTSVSGLHRIANTALHPSQMSGSREESLQQTLQRIASNPAVPAMALTSMPMAFITGAEYGRLTREVSRSTGKPILHVPGKSLSGDWLDGYAEVLLALATQLDLSGGSPSTNKVGIVGYLYDRNEADHAANLGELKRMCEAVGLELVSVWLSGQDFGQLGAIRDASVIISMPYARKAARQVAKRTGARLLEMDLPLGLQTTEAWVRQLATITGEQQAAERYIDEQLASIVPKLEWVIPFVFQNRSVAFVGDPYVLPGIAELVSTVGMRLSFAVITNRPLHAAGLAERLPGVDLLVYPKMKGLMKFLTQRFVSEPPQLTIANNAGILGGEGAVFEFGFPSFFRHTLYDRPFLGFNGALALLDSMAFALRWYEVETTRRNMR
jgi:nitrogenase molybdenum-iron protein alpha/beta subunit